MIALMRCEFTELRSAYINRLMSNVREQKGEQSPEYKALYYQYVRTSHENESLNGNKKHYEASLNDDEKSSLRLIERLYKRQATVNLTNACNAHCRYCLRQNYAPFNLTSGDVNEIASYLGNDDNLHEVLLTGGDPLLAYSSLIDVAGAIIAKAPNIKIIRIGTRLPVQNPIALSEKIINFFADNQKKVFFEVGLQVNHVVELTGEAKSCIETLQDAGVLIYAQNVLLKNVNDNMDALIDLYDSLRYLHIESHYLFHPVPIAGTAHFRMPVRSFLDIARKLTASGEIPGRSKPMFSVMTDVGKVTLYDGVIKAKDEAGYLHINTAYSYEKRRYWNPHFQLPGSASVLDNGEMMVKYLDGDE